MKRTMEGCVVDVDPENRLLYICSVSRCFDYGASTNG